MAEGGISDRSAGSGPATRTKVVVLGGRPGEVPPAPFRSLNLEHVSPMTLTVGGISRRPAPAVADEDTALAPLRRWFFARKPDAGFVLTGFPATLLQAKVLDEWLETRGEALSAVVARAGAPPAVVGHYRMLGLLDEETAAPALP